MAEHPSASGARLTGCDKIGISHICHGRNVEVYRVDIRALGNHMFFVSFEVPFLENARARQPISLTVTNTTFTGVGLHVDFVGAKSSNGQLRLADPSHVPETYAVEFDQRGHGALSGTHPILSGSRCIHGCIFDELTQISTLDWKVARNAY